MDDLAEKLPDEFSRTVLHGSLMVVQDKSNPIRQNLFAAGMRELFGHVLHAYAPDEDVRACRWFEQSVETTTVTRKQRAVYATQGGLSDDYVAGLGVDVDELHKDAIKSIQKLNKATHVRLGQIIEDQDVIESFVEDALGSLAGLLGSFQICRNEVNSALQDNVYDAMMDAFITETFDDINILAGKGYEADSFFIDDDELIIETINATHITLKFSGDVPVTLHYGPKDDAAEIRHVFPFWMRFEAPVEHPERLRLIDHFFDDSSWYE